MNKANEQSKTRRLILTYETLNSRVVTGEVPTQLHDCLRKLQVPARPDTTVARSWKLVAMDELIVCAQSYSDPMVVEDCEGKQRAEITCCRRCSEHEADDENRHNLFASLKAQETRFGNESSVSHEQP